MNAWLWNGSSFETATGLPLTDRGFRYGMSLFESMRVVNGRVDFWEQHKLRLLAACAERGFPLDERALVQAVDLLASDATGGFARIYVTAGDGGPSGAVEKARVFVLLEPRADEKETCWEMCFHDETYHPPFGGLKTGNYWFNCDALAQARARRFEEAVLFNDHAELVSACCANIFLVHDDVILTPSRGSGCRLGVVREWVINRRKVIERRLRREDVLKADEIFLTNSWLGIMPIATLEGRPLGPRSIGPKLVGEMQVRWRG